MSLYSRITVKFLLQIVILFIAVWCVIGATFVFYLYSKKSAPAEGLNTLVVLLLLFTGSLLVTIFVAIFFGRRMGAPIIHMMNWLQNLANKSYSEPTDQHGIPKSKINIDGDFRKTYRIYRDVFLALENLAFSLQQSDLERKRMEKTREEWITGITHDLRTPLSSVKGYADLFTSAEYKWTDSEIREFGKVISDKATYMDELIDDLGLTFKLKNADLPLNRSPENIVEIVRRVVIDLINDPRTERQTVLFESEVDTIIYPVDAKWLIRALDNLLTNSSLHNPVGTTISVNVQSLCRKELQYSGVRMELWDNGTGMDKETVDRLFDRYYRGTNTSDHQVKGSGLGAAIAKQLIEAHDGIISVESKLGWGTTIVIELPPKN